MEPKAFPLLAFTLALAAQFGAAPGFAQSYPAKPVRVLMASSTGGNPDRVLQLTRPIVEEALGQPLVVEPRPGSVVAAMATKDASPDGYTILYTHSGNYAQDQFLMLNMPLDWARDLKPVAPLTNAVVFLIATGSIPAKSMKELVQYAKTRPGGLNYGSIGALSELAAGIIKEATGAQLVSVGYKTGASAVPDLLAGRIDFIYGALPLFEGLVNEGKLRALAVSGPQRSELRADVPTFIEQGIPLGDSLSSWGLFAPGATPDPVVSKLHGAFSKALNDPAVRSGVQKAGYVPVVAKSPEEYGTAIAAERTKIARLVKALGMKPQ